MANGKNVMKIGRIDMPDKYKAACIEYAEARSSVKALTESIGVCLDACDKQQEDDQVHHFDHADHLKMAYEMTRDDDDNSYFVNHDGNPGLYLMDLCKHCYRAHVYVQARKEARQRFGIAKRRIGLLGANLIKTEGSKEL